MPRNGIARSRGSLFSFFEKPPYTLHSDCTSLDSHRQCRRIPFSSHPLQHVLFVFFLITALLIGVRWYVFVIVSGCALLWWLLMLSIFSCACWPSAFPLWKTIYSDLLPIFNFFLMLSCKSYLYLLNINPYDQMYWYFKTQLFLLLES